MKYILLFTFLFYYYSALMEKQNLSEDIEQTEKNIDTCSNGFLTDELKKTKAQIDSMIIEITPIQSDLMGYSSQGGEILSYIIGNDTLFVLATFYGEFGKSEQKFYNSNNIPFLYEKIDYKYIKSIYEESQPKIDYIKKDIVIMQNFIIKQWCHFGKELPNEDFDFMSSEIHKTYNIISGNQEN